MAAALINTTCCPLENYCSFREWNFWHFFSETDKKHLVWRVTWPKTEFSMCCSYLMKCTETDVYTCKGGRKTSQFMLSLLFSRELRAVYCHQSSCPKGILFPYCKIPAGTSEKPTHALAGTDCQWIALANISSAQQISLLPDVFRPE